MTRWGDSCADETNCELNTRLKKFCNNWIQKVFFSPAYSTFCIWWSVYKVLFYIHLVNNNTTFGMPLNGHTNPFGRPVTSHNSYNLTNPCAPNMDTRQCVVSMTNQLTHHNHGNTVNTMTTLLTRVSMTNSHCEDASPIRTRIRTTLVTWRSTTCTLPSVTMVTSVDCLLTRGGQYLSSSLTKPGIHTPSPHGYNRYHGYTPSIVVYICAYVSKFTMIFLYLCPQYKSYTYIYHVSLILSHY